MRHLERWLPAWIIGVAASFLLPALPDGYTAAAAGFSLAALAWRNRFAAFLLVMFLGAAYGVIRTEAELVRQWPAVHQVRAQPLVIEVDGLPVRDEKRVRFEARVTDAAGRKSRVLLSDYGRRDWPVGSVWQVAARVRAPVGEVNAGGFDREAWALANGLHGIGTVGKERRALGLGGPNPLLALRSAVSGNWQSVQGFENGTALMRALSIGEQGALPDAAWQALRPLGLTHLVSISGLHVSMVGLLAVLLLRQLLRVLPVSFKRPRTVLLTAGVSAAFLYALLAGFDVPTQRTVLMLAAFAWAWHKGWGSSAWFGWRFALGAVLLFDPSAVLGTGTWLSFGLVAALLWVGAWRLEENGWRIFWRAQWALAAVSVVALGSLFASLPLISPLVNLLAVPWFSWVLVPLALLASAFPLDFLQTLAAGAAEYTVQVLFWLADDAPEWAVAAAPAELRAAAVMAAGIALLPRGLGLRPWAFLVLAGFILYRPPAVPKKQLDVRIWDVGQGSAVSFHTASKTLLFDTGTASAAQMQLLPGLRSAGVRNLSGLILSHHDSDHDGGAEIIRQAFAPERIWAGQPAFYPGAESCRNHTSWQWDGVHFEWLGLSENTAEDNDRSCVLRVVAGGKAVLLTGDLSQKGERALLARYGKSLFSQLLILGHHGSNGSSSGAFLNAVSPQYAVASSGFANAYGHPSQAVRTRLSAHGIRLLRTDLSGGFLIRLEQGNDIKPVKQRENPVYWKKKPFGREIGR